MRSHPPSLHLITGKEGMIHFLFGSHVQKLESAFFSDWSRNNTYDSLCSDWLNQFLITTSHEGKRNPGKKHDFNSEFICF